MEQCPICRAQLNGADICRRCRAELGKVRQIARQGEAWAGAAMYFLALGERGKAACLLRRANTLRATLEISWILSKIEVEEATDAQRIDDGRGRVANAD
jgi:hypothetical protein